MSKLQLIVLISGIVIILAVAGILFLVAYMNYQAYLSQFGLVLPLMKMLL